MDTESNPSPMERPVFPPIVAIPDLVDTRSWPKGSIRRRYAAKLNRRRNAKVMLAGHLIKAGEPVPEAVVRIVENSRVSVEPEVIDLGDNYKDIILWVWEHLDRRKCPKGVSGKVRSMWRVAHKDPAGFMQKYLPFLAKSEEKAEQRIDVGADNALALCEEWLRNYKGEK